MNYTRESYISTPLFYQKYLLHFLNKKKKLIILDIGSCEGEDSIRYSRLFPNSSIYSFEPLPNNQELIKENIIKYNVKNIELIPFAVDNKIGTSVFYTSSGEPDGMLNEDWTYGNKSSSLLPPGKHLDVLPWLKFEDKIIVNTISLEHFLEDNNIVEVNLIHLDVQGAELRVLESARKYIEKIQIVWLEVSNVELYKGQPKRVDIERFMTSNGYTLYKSFMNGNFGDQMYVKNGIVNDTYLKVANFFNNRFSFIRWNLR